MTPALKAMVEAMRDEIGRQVSERGGHWVPSSGPVEQLDGPYDGHDGLDSLDARFDLEKVARAGLEAIREPDETIRAGGAAADAAADPFIGTEHEGVPADPANAAEHWWFMISAILGEKP